MHLLFKNLQDLSGNKRLNEEKADVTIWKSPKKNDRLIINKVDFPFKTHLWVCPAFLWFHLCAASHIQNIQCMKKLGLIVSLTPKQHAVINRATSVRHNLQYVRQCGKSGEKCLQNLGESEAHKVDGVSMYKLISSTLFFNGYIKKVP